MGTTATQIENHIEDKRQDLTSNLHELESRVKSITDWRYQYEHRPWIFLGAAIAAGVGLAAMVGRSAGSRVASENRAYRSSGSSPVADELAVIWDNVKGALIGLAADRLKDYADEIIPGFSQQYQQAQSMHRRSA